MDIKRPPSSKRYGRPSTSSRPFYKSAAPRKKNVTQKGECDEDPLDLPKPQAPQKSSKVPEPKSTDLVINTPPPEDLLKMMHQKPSMLPTTREFFGYIIHRRYVEVKRMLKEKIVDVNSRDLDDELLPTPLLIATEMNDTELVKILVTAKPKPANVNDENINGRRPIWWAAKWANVEITDWLLNGSQQQCEVNILDKQSGCAPLYRAILSNAAEIVRLLIHAGADINLRILGLDVAAETPLIKAIQMDNKDICELLVNSLCKLQVKTTGGLNALHYAVAYRRYSICEYLLESGTKVNAKSPSGVTAMTVAVEQHNSSMVRILLEFGYKMDKRYKWKETPLEHAIKIHSEECAITLMHYGCSLQRDKKSKGPSYFYMAVNEKQMRIAKFMAALNPPFFNEAWVQQKRWPVSIYRKPEIIKWLENESQQVKSLKNICRASVFRYLGRYGINKVEKLNIPESMKTFLKFQEFINEKAYNRKPLDKKCCPFDCPSYCPNKRCLPIEISSSESEGEESSSEEEQEDEGEYCNICRIRHSKDTNHN